MKFSAPPKSEVRRSSSVTSSRWKPFWDANSGPAYVVAVPLIITLWSMS